MSAGAGLQTEGNLEGCGKVSVDNEIKIEYSMLIFVN
jgi:hypothetical protein